MLHYRLGVRVWSSRVYVLQTVLRWPSWYVNGCVLASSPQARVQPMARNSPRLVLHTASRLKLGTVCVHGVLGLSGFQSPGLFVCTAGLAAPASASTLAAPQRACPDHVDHLSLKEMLTGNIEAASIYTFKSRLKVGCRVLVWLRV